MSEATSAAIAAPINDAATLTALPSGSPMWQRWLSLGLSAALFLVICIELFGPQATIGDTLLPSAPGFYVGLVASYVALPLFDWLIFRRLWDLPTRGIVPLFKKRALNDLLFGYSGELYFYLWTRQRVGLAQSPFGTIKDVAILSALAGNAMTLLLLVLSMPIAGRLDLGIDPALLFGSGTIVIGLSLFILLLRTRLFSLPVSKLQSVFGLHMARISISTLALALAWFAAMPAVGVVWWVALSALRLLISRLPLLPNRELLFAAAALFLIGGASGIGALAAVSSGLMLLMNLVVGLTLAFTDFRRGRTIGLEP